jgi:hypothetical protein
VRNQNKAKHERKTTKRLGCMQLHRIVETLPSHQRVLMRFGIVSDLRCESLPCFQWFKTQPEVVKLMATTKATRKDNMKQDVRAVEVALAKMSLQQLAELKLRWAMHSVLN